MLTSLWEDLVDGGFHVVAVQKQSHVKLTWALQPSCSDSTLIPFCFVGHWTKMEMHENSKFWDLLGVF